MLLLSDVCIERWVQRSYISQCTYQPIHRLYIQEYMDVSPGLKFDMTVVLNGFILHYVVLRNQGLMIITLIFLIYNGLIMCGHIQRMGISLLYNLKKRYKRGSLHITSVTKDNKGSTPELGGFLDLRTENIDKKVALEFVVRSWVHTLRRSSSKGRT